MEKNTTTIIISLLTLIIGFGGGYALAAERDIEEGQHRMAGGDMMRNGSMDMDSAMDGMMSALEGKKGDEFDKAFLSEMIVHHQGAVKMAEAARTSAKHSEIKQMAQDIITAQTGEIKQMQTWQTSWYEAQ